LEAFAALVTGIAMYVAYGGSWLAFVPLVLLPDLSALGYVAGPRLGSITYNAVHNWAVALAALGAGIWLATPWLVLAGATLIAHVGADRLFGFGLKYPTFFKDTHLQHV
jgi:uncharacterized protein DUF4260